MQKVRVIRLILSKTDKNHRENPLLGNSALLQLIKYPPKCLVMKKWAKFSLEWNF